MTIFVVGTAMVRVTVFVSGFAIFFASATTLLLVLNINSSAAHFVSSSTRSIKRLAKLNGILDELIRGKMCRIVG